MRDVAEYSIVAGSRPWNRELFDTHEVFRKGDFSFVADDDDLEGVLRDRGSPRFVFFLHWSQIVPEAIWGEHECVVFHMTDLPYGRGGSPLQNLIDAGHATTVVSALRMTREVDAGPVYARRPLDLSGSAQEIYERAGVVSAEMIAGILADRPEPVEQTGPVVKFRRRTPDQSQLPATTDIDRVYDFIRMLDAEGYPRAYLDHDDLRLEFRDAVRIDDTVEATVAITVRGTSS